MNNRSGNPDKIFSNGFKSRDMDIFLLFLKKVDKFSVYQIFINQKIFIFCLYSY